jgi:hypothetical protein
VVMQPYSRWVGFAWLAVGVLIYWYNHGRKKSQQGSSELEVAETL